MMRRLEKELKVPSMEPFKSTLVILANKVLKKINKRYFSVEHDNTYLRDAIAEYLQQSGRTSGVPKTTLMQTLGNHACIEELLTSMCNINGSICKLKDVKL